jgi:hypothetical protein
MSSKGLMLLGVYCSIREYIASVEQFIDTEGVV